MRKISITIAIFIGIAANAQTLVKCPQDINCSYINPPLNTLLQCNMENWDGKSWGLPPDYDKVFSAGIYKFMAARSYNGTDGFCYYSQSNLPLVGVQSQVSLQMGPGNWQLCGDNAFCCGDYDPNGYATCQYTSTKSH